ncbi:SIR2 family protein [Dactylosporangium vinaceum]|uniref:SIR2 family protein n=1 Tax=Dactylosporangium vinaceum TaxID=53362 RepID=A0ABV5MLD3_9ACTN|nr:SIR2 family protein [Dactylosporangium vinaceum]UAB96985.1 SIR2 family protein [Dactylosporangium vinaceum]
MDMVQLPWRRVWTLNIDDTFERAYDATINPISRKLQIVNWDEPYSESGDLQVIHLHGHVRGSRPSKLVFSFAEYQAAAKTHPVWDQVLAGVMGTEPFLVIGARMLEDPDIESLLMKRPPNGTAPSFVVDPYISAGNKWELERLGFVVLELMPEEVLQKWRHEFDLMPEALLALTQSHALSVPQFSKLQTNRTSPPPSGHDFYGGDLPLWSDACDGRIAIFSWVKRVVDDLERWTDASSIRSEPTLHIVYGLRLTGSSSGLHAVAREAISMHVDPYVFDKSSRWDVPLLVDLARQRPALIIIDGGAEFADDVDRTLKLAEEDGVRLYILLAETPHNDLRLEGRLSGTYSKVVTHVPERLNRIDGAALVTKLEKFGRLGSLELKESRQRLQHFVGRDVFSSMMDVEYALGFRKRLEGELAELHADWRLDLVFLLSLAAQANRPVGLIDASIAIGVAADKINEQLRADGHLAAVVEQLDDRLVARQRDRAVESVANIIGSNRALDKLLEFIQRLAPLASRSSLQRRNRVPLLVGHLMTSKNLQATFPGHDLDNFYESLRPTFGDWNGRYWEQRAIYAKATLDWSRAESFAARSVSLYDDAYTRTTYGTILINKAENLAALGDSAWREYYDRGRQELETAQAKEPGSRVTAFAYLESTLALLQRLAEAGADDSQDAVTVAADWSAYYATLRIGLTGEHLQSVSRAERLGERWERLRLANRS